MLTLTYRSSLSVARIADRNTISCFVIAPAQTTTTDVPQALALGASNEYGQFDQHALALYKLDMVVEPFRETKLSVVHSATPTSTFHPSTRFRWFLAPADDTGGLLEGEKALVDSKGGSAATWTFTEPGMNYALLVEQLSQDGKTVVTSGKATVACKYVRRELRALTNRDRTEFFQAMQVFYTIPADEAREKYGSDFWNYAKVSAYHNSKVRDDNGQF